MTLHRNSEEQEARLAQLAATERQLSRHVEQLKSDTALQERRIQTLKSEEQEALRRLGGLQRTETEQTLRLEALQADEQNRQSEIVVLEQRRDNLGDQIRLDLLGPGEKERPSTVERDGAFPDHHASSRLPIRPDFSLTGKYCANRMTANSAHDQHAFLTAIAASPKCNIAPMTSSEAAEPEGRLSAPILTSPHPSQAPVYRAASGSQNEVILISTDSESEPMSESDDETDDDGVPSAKTTYEHIDQEIPTRPNTTSPCESASEPLKRC